jgi:hypothetical protein
LLVEKLTPEEIADQTRIVQERVFRPADQVQPKAKEGDVFSQLMHLYAKPNVKK